MKSVFWSFGAAMLALIGPTPEARADATCFCKVSFNNLINQTSATGVCQDLTGQIAKTYSGIYQQHEDNQVDCKVLCNKATTPLVNAQSVATGCCAAGGPNQAYVRVFSAVGNKKYRLADDLSTFRVLTNKPAVKQAKCPASWHANPTNQDGGVTSDGKCKKWSGTMNIIPSPPNDTQIGTYGFTWGNSVIAWGTSGNGGAAVVTTIVAPVCSL